MIASIKNGLRRAWYGGLSRREFQALDWQNYRIDLSKPFVEIEPLEQEKRIVDRALGVLKSARILSSTHYEYRANTWQCARPSRMPLRFPGRQLRRGCKD